MLFLHDILLSLPYFWCEEIYPTPLLQLLEKEKLHLLETMAITFYLYLGIQKRNTILLVPILPLTTVS